jgi:hypothetical protein
MFSDLFFMGFLGVLGKFSPGANPYVALAAGVFNAFGERGYTPWPAYERGMGHAREHLGFRLTLAAQLIQGPAEIFDIRRRRIAVPAEEEHVVDFVRARQ